MDSYLKEWGKGEGMMVELVKILRTTSVINGKDIKGLLLGG